MLYSNGTESMESFTYGNNILILSAFYRSTDLRSTDEMRAIYLTSLEFATTS
jgi:hypothetical protein